MSPLSSPNLYSKILIHGRGYFLAQKVSRVVRGPEDFDSVGFILHKLEREKNLSACHCFKGTVI
jgi:hypothetical protein